MDHRDGARRDYGLGALVEKLLVVTGGGFHTGLGAEGAGRAGDLPIWQWTEETRPASNDNQGWAVPTGSMIAAGAM